MPNKQYPAPLWRDEINCYLSYLRAAGQRPETVKTRSRQLVRLSLDLADVRPEAVTPAAVLEWFESKQWARETRRSARDAVNLFYEWMKLTGRRCDNPACVLPRVRRTSPSPHPCPDSVIRAALLDAKPDVRLMIRLAAECGLRRNEIAQTGAADVLDGGDGYSLIVHGKGGKQRIVPMPDDLARDVIAYDGPCFRGRFGGSVEASYVGKRVGAALPKGYSCHSLRHRYATKLYAETRDILLVSKMLGHTKVETTMAYVALPSVGLQETMRAISVV